MLLVCSNEELQLISLELGVLRGSVAQISVSLPGSAPPGRHTKRTLLPVDDCLAQLAAKMLPWLCGEAQGRGWGGGRDNRPGRCWC